MAGELPSAYKGERILTAAPLPTRRSELTAQLNRETNHVIRTVKPSVVSIYSSAIVFDPETGMPREGQIAGSGFVVPWRTEDGKYVIATNRHVVQNAIEDPGATVNVVSSNVTADGKVRKHGMVYGSVELLYASPDYDIAFITVDPREHPEEVLPPVTFGSSSDVHEGYRIAAIGNPYNINDTSSVGHVANEGIKQITTEYGTNPVFQVDVALRQGDSGGVIVNLEDGKVIGVPDIQIANDPSTGLAIPIEVVMSELKKASQLYIAALQRRQQYAQQRPAA